MNLLIVEDDLSILSFLDQAFRSEGFVTDCADDGLSGMRKAKTNDYDLIILDNMLPHKSGKEMCKELRTIGKDTRIMMLSVGSEIETKVDLLNIGADDYMTKPFVFNELLARSRALLRRKEKFDTTLLSTFDITLDTNQKIVRRGDKQIILTPKEFLLLEYMLRNKGRMLSRIMLLEHVWDINANLFSNTVEAHILSLRKKLGHTKSNPIIHTISGSGYRIEI